MFQRSTRPSSRRSLAPSPPPRGSPSTPRSTSARWRPASLPANGAVAVRHLERRGHRIRSLRGARVVRLAMAPAAGRAARSRGAAGAASLALALEASQWIVGFRECRAWPDARRSTRRRSSAHRCGPFATLAVGPFALVLVCSVLSVRNRHVGRLGPPTPFEVAAARRPFTRAPCCNYYERTSLATVSHTLELVLLYFPVGFAFWLALRAARTRLAGGHRRYSGHRLSARVSPRMDCRPIQ